MRKSLRKISAAIAGCALAMALTVGAVPNAANAAVKPQCTKDGEKAGKAKFIRIYGSNKRCKVNRQWQVDYFVG